MFSGLAPSVLTCVGRNEEDAPAKVDMFKHGFSLALNMVSL